MLFRYVSLGSSLIYFGVVFIRVLYCAGDLKRDPNLENYPYVSQFAFGIFGLIAPELGWLMPWYPGPWLCLGVSVGKA